MKKAMLFTSIIGGISIAVISVSALDNTGFELPDQGDSGYSYNPSKASWTFSAGSGVSGPNGPWKCNSTSPDPFGDQFAYLQRATSISQDMSGLVVGGTYDLSFYESYRTEKDPGNDLLVFLDEGMATEMLIYSNGNVNSSTWVSRSTDQFTAEKSTYFLTFRSTFPLATGDCTTIIDGVHLNLLELSAISYLGISNDSDCKISTFKTYTHKLDFGSGTPGALINGVQFDAISSDPLNFSRTRSSGTLGVHGGNTPPGVSGNLVNLMRDMYYNGANDAGGITTWTLSGLTAGETYDARIYTRQWGPSATRVVSMVFDPDGAGTVADVTGVISEDETTSVGMAADTDPYYINYRFTAVSAEDLVITVTQQNYNASWHLYGISCEVVEPTPIITIPADNANGVLLSDDLVATFDVDIVKASGNITLKKSNDDSVVEILDVNSASVTILGAEVIINLSNDLERGTGYYVQIDGGAFEDKDGIGSPAVTESTAWNFTTVLEVFSFVHITDDADCGIASHREYTHKLDFGAGTPGALINGVQFNAYNAMTNGTLNFVRTVSTGTPLDLAGNPPPNISGSLVDLMTDMYYNGSCAGGGITTWTLSGLTPGYHYETRIYTRQWDPGTRICSMVFDPDGAGPISDSVLRIFEDDAITVGMDAANDAYYINYPFTAVEGEDLVITVTQHEFDKSWHLYGITNERIPPDGTLIIVE